MESVDSKVDVKKSNQLTTSCRDEKSGQENCIAEKQVGKINSEELACTNKEGLWQNSGDREGLQLMTVKWRCSKNLCLLYGTSRLQ